MLCAAPSQADILLNTALQELADEHEIIFKGLDETAGVVVDEIDGTVDERLKGLLKDFNYILVQSGSGAPERVVIMHPIAGRKFDLKPIPTVTRPGNLAAEIKEPPRSSDKQDLMTLVAGGKLSSGYGMRMHPILGYRVMHRGIDLAAPRGTPVRALADGKINFAGRNGAYGNYLRIRHSEVYQTAFGHLHGFADGIKKGGQVRRGDVIGYVGSTGRSTGPHLHFELIVDGTRVDPIKELAAFRDAVVVPPAEEVFQQSTSAKLVRLTPGRPITRN